MVAENKVAKRVKATCKTLGLRAIRISMQPGVETGWMDYFVLGPNRHMIGIETKATGKPARPIQKERARELMAYGFAWAKPDTVEDVDFTLVNFARYCMDQPPLTREQVETMNWTQH